ncbi:MAG TPA: histidine kinase, partial [Longimicrobiales bacterium]
MPLRDAAAQPEGGIDEQARLPADPASATAESPWMGRRALLVSLAFWTLFGALTASNWLLSPLGQNFPYPGRIVAKAFYQAYVWALLTPAIFRLAARVNPESGARLRRVLLLLGIGLFTGALVAGVQVAGSALLFPPGSLGGRPEPSGWMLARFYFPTAVVTFFVVLIAGLMSDISRRYRARQREAGQLRAERAELQAQAARLQAQSAELHAQLAEARLAMLARFYFPTAVVTFFVVLVAGLMSDISRRYRARQREANQLQAERAELKAQAARLQAQSAELHAQLAEARLAMLRTRFNPHFLFNTLNAVS